MFDRFVPKFSKQLLQSNVLMTNAVAQYNSEVKTQLFPAPVHEFQMKPKILEEFLALATATDQEESMPTSHQEDSNLPLFTTRFPARRSARRVANMRSLSTRTRPFSTSALTQCMVSSSISEFRLLRDRALHQQPTQSKQYRLGFVPTMGALHSGHMSLVSTAMAQCDIVAVSIFVNPLQFAAHEDLDRYPRPLSADLALLADAGVNLVFTPDVRELYPQGRDNFGLRVCFANADSKPEGQARPGFFDGVGTVVAKLFNIVGPDAAFFGQKDGQQCAVVKQLVRDMNFPLDVVVCPTTRDADGLAQSSRNVYLSPSERAIAPVVFQALQAIQRAHAAGQTDVSLLRQAAHQVLACQPACTLQYLAFATSTDLTTLQDTDHVHGNGYLVSIAVQVGAVRLIDNILL
jgi:pantoate--beta-alanine ligase